MANVAEAAEELRSRIRAWLEAEGWRVEERAVEDTSTSAAKEVSWALQGTDPGGKLVLFAQDARRPDVLVLQAGVTIDPNHTGRLRSLERREQEEFCWDLRFRLLDMGVNFGGIQVPLETVGLIERLYIEDMGRNRFFESVGRLQNAILAVIWMIRRRLDQPAPADDYRGGVAVN
jgi:hypothetical protein